MLLVEIENVEEWVAERLDYNNQDFEQMDINLAELALWQWIKREFSKFCYLEEINCSSFILKIVQNLKLKCPQNVLNRDGWSRPMSSKCPQKGWMVQNLLCGVHLIFKRSLRKNLPLKTPSPLRKNLPLNPLRTRIRCTPPP